jgi:hypothetical protein
MEVPSFSIAWVYGLPFVFDQSNFALARLAIKPISSKTQPLGWGKGFGKTFPHLPTYNLIFIILFFIYGAFTL